MVTVLHYVSIMNRGGQETFIMNVFRSIDRRKVTFDFLCTLSEKGDYDDEIDALGGNIYSLELGYCKVQLMDRLYALSAFLKKHKGEYDVFHIHTQHAMDGYLNAIVAKKSGIKKVVVHSHSTSTLYHPLLHYFFRPFLNTIKIDKFACSDMAGEWLFGKGKKYRIIRNGVNVEAFSYSNTTRDKIRLENGWNDYTIIGHVGSMTYPKNHEFILDVFSEYIKINPKSILVLIGTGPLKNVVENKIENLKLKKSVILMGSRNDVNLLDQGLDLFLFPSRYEGLPVVLVEAQCTGVNCLISDTITPEVDVTENLYRLSLEEKAECWAKKIDEIITSTSERTSMSNAVKKAGFDIKDTALELKKFYCDN